MTLHPGALRPALLTAFLVATITLGTTARAADVDARRILGADREPQNWLTVGRTYSEQRYSPLEKINTGNVGQLGLAWYYDIKMRTARGLEATPLVVDGVMYTSTAWSHVVALDARTGKQLWEFNPQVNGAIAGRACCDVVNRGVAAWGGNIYVGVLDGRLIALDAKTGKVVWQVQTTDPKKDYAITGAPRVVDGKVLIGNGGAEYNARGYISAYDADNGKLIWRFYTVPGDPKLGFENKTMEMAAKTWSGEWWKQGGGGTVWNDMAYDPQLKLLYFGVGNGVTWNSEIRSEGKGDNLFIDSIVAVHIDTGEYAWHFQQVPGDEWDYDATQHIILADLPIDGRMRKVLMQAPKNGYFYVLDRETGEFISGTPYATVTWSTGLDPKTGRPNIKPEVRYSQTGKPALVIPGAVGAHNWQATSYSPKTGLVYIPAIEAGFAYAPIDPKKYTYREGLLWNLGLDPVDSAMPEDEKIRTAIRKSSTGRLVAWDPVLRAPMWIVQHPLAWNGGVLSTAGNLVFQGDGQGHFVAYNAATGAKLWDFHAQTGIIAAPMTFSLDGEQYVAVLAGWGGVVPLPAGEIVKDAANTGSSRVLVFKIGGTAKLPPVVTVKRQLNPPPAKASKAVVDAGRGLYQQYCAACHGDTASSGGVIPDLRYSATLVDPAAWKSIVLDGTLVENGMIAFKQFLKPEDVETIRAYVIKRAHDELKNIAGTKRASN
ncbi:MAG TPA: PQQ-dependent dehydrogenase, methanol/ethanol family [Alphaproteobacteria bacterium]|nr:PQQ-dependent dehydrogenase, methanol/ethanol family [Alphaproteobacteria bacterium]